MDIKTKIESLVLLADSRVLGFAVQAPENLTGAKILESTLEKYCPPFEDRLLYFSWPFAYRRWLRQAPENSKTSLDEFKQLCLVPESYHLYSDAVQELSKMLPKNITLEYLKPVLG